MFFKNQAILPKNEHVPIVIADFLKFPPHISDIQQVLSD